MWQEIEIIIRNYIPDKLKTGMLFFSIINEGTDKEKINIWALNEFVLNEEFFIQTSGYPIEILINLDDENVIDLQSLPLFDFDNTEHYYEMSLKELNIILNEFDSVCDILIYEETEEPKLIDGKVVLRFLKEEEE